MNHDHKWNSYDRCQSCGVRKVVVLQEYLESDHDLDTRQEVVGKALAILED